MNFDRKELSNDDLIRLYRNILLPRLIEEKMLILLRQGRISKWFSGIGQEAIAAGATMAMQDDEWIMPLHRNLGVFTARGLPLDKLFRQWQGSKEGYSKGRERSFHFGTREHAICGMISHLGPQLAIADGAALAYKLSKKNKASLAFTGEGASSEGDFHEALNVASVWDLPVIFLVENNGYALSTPVSEQYRCESLVYKAEGYGMEGVRIDGNNILTVYDTLRGVREYCIKYQRPYLVECMTFRMRGHEEASGTKYVPASVLEDWAKKDPVTNFEGWLIEEQILSAADVAGMREDIKARIEADLKPGLAEEPVVPDTAGELRDVYAPLPVAASTPAPTPAPKSAPAPIPAPPQAAAPAPAPAPAAAPVPAAAPKLFRGRVPGNQQAPAAPPAPSPAPAPHANEKRFIEAIREGLERSMEQHPGLILMGQDIAEYGGAFKITEGLMEKFGKARVRNTPLCESAILGCALGLSLEGYKSVVEMQFADFVTAGFNQIVNNLAKIYYRWGQNADVVIRMPTGAGVGAGPFHSQSNEAWFFHTPGLKVVYPSTPADAKGLL
ncbi:MAG: thiamine pyrophosphate-dependent enzyme, partial [Bacteroidota bacterium]|nr:thiamine pyrophosphate-dependent enzyme [Bacteroidota bacterium]MDP4217120.1 thiamine pyrophosphate-dependent enzyme [Bacteroidota bacterium]